MVLNSQSPQPSLRRQYMARRHKSPRWPWIAAVVAVVVLVTWMLVNDSDDTTQSADAASSSTPPARSTTPAAPPAEAPVRTQPITPTQERPTLRQSAAAPQQPAAQETPRTEIVTPTAPPEQPATTPPPTHVATTPHADSPTQYTEGMTLIADGKVVEGRALLSRLLFEPDLRLRPADAMTARDALASINKHLVFGKAINEDDPLVDQYVIQPNDYLVKIAPNYHVPADFIQRLNGVDPTKLHVGQKLKVIRGPFHCRISKRDYRLDVYVKDDMGQPIYITSLPVGLGEGNSTPVGNYVIRPNSKLKNPGWTNPRTHQTYDANDPANPIGEYWLGLLGTDPTTESLSGYGIHGTIDPDSIGSQQSMGCVRLRDADIEQLFHMLVPGESTVQIVP